MKQVKGVFSGLVGMLLVTSSLWSLDFKTFKYDGSFELNSLKTANETDLNNPANDQRQRTALRVSLGVRGALANDVTFRVEANRVPPAALTHGQFGTIATTLHGEENYFTFDNAYFDVKNLIFDVDARVGRQFVNFGLIGYAGKYDNDALAVAGVDAVKLTRNFDWLNGTLLLAKPVEAVANGVVDGAPGDQNVNALVLSANLKDVVDSLPSVPVSLGYFGATDQNTATPNDNNNLGIYSLKAGVSLLNDALSLGLDWATNTGALNTAATTKLDYKGSLTALSAAYNFSEYGLDASFEYALASGDDNVQAATGEDKSWRDLVSFGLGPNKAFGEILGRTNAGPNPTYTQGLDTGAQGPGLRVMALGVKYTPDVLDKKLRASLDYITAESDKQATGLTTSEKIGTEIDLAATYKKSDSVWFTLGYATFSPRTNSTLLANGNFSDDVNRFFAKAGVRF